MNFKERFKGKTSTISKQGTIGEAVIKPLPVNKRSENELSSLPNYLTIEHPENNEICTLFNNPLHSTW